MNVWLARDASGELFMYGSKPTRKSSFFMVESKEANKSYWEMQKDLLPEVTWENSPKEYMLTMEIYELKAQIKKGGVN